MATTAVLLTLLWASGRPGEIPGLTADQAKESAVAALEKLGGRVEYVSDDKNKPVAAVFLDQVKDPTGALKLAKDFPSLRKLAITGTELPESARKELCEFTGLTALQLRLVPLADRDVAAMLVCLTKLESLELMDTGITDRALADLGRARHLRALYLFDRKLTAGALKGLPSLKHLQRLVLAQCSVSDDAVPIIERVTGLRQIALADTKISVRAAQALRNALPKAWVLYFPRGTLLSPPRGRGK